MVQFSPDLSRLQHQGHLQGSTTVSFDGKAELRDTRFSEHKPLLLQDKFGLGLAAFETALMRHEDFGTDVIAYEELAQAVVSNLTLGLS